MPAGARSPEWGRQQGARRHSQPAPSEHRVSKRSPNACERCRRQKVKCSGHWPCDACERRSITCNFNELDQKIMISRGYVEELQRKAEAAATRRSGGMAEGTTSESATNVDDDPGEASRQDSVAGVRVGGGDMQIDEPSISRMGSEGPGLTNLLSTGRSTYMTADDGMLFYLGTSSNWSFARKILGLTHEHLFGRPLPAKNLLFDGCVYQLDWDGSRTSAGPRTPVLPALDHSIYLINAVKFHCGQLYHIFDDEEFMPTLYEFYNRPSPGSVTEELWYVHLLLILAFGKAFTSKRSQGKRAPGDDMFTKALSLLPSEIMLWKHPLQSCEVLCCIALYLQCLDCRIAAHNYIGQAMRIALGHGFHTDMPVDRLGEQLVERSRRIWWTVYILDREMTSLMGLPQSVHDDDVHPQLPTFSGVGRRSAALDLQIKLSRVISSINRTIYGIGGKLNRRFLKNTKAALADVAGLADELRQSCPLQLENSASGLSRTSAHLHLLYHRCMVLATRPLLFCFLKIRLESKEMCAKKLGESETARTLMQICLDSSLQTTTILDALRSQGVLETFLPFDLESLFISTVSEIVGPVIDPQFLDNDASWLKRAYSIFDELIGCGNQVAVFRKAELLQLDEMLKDLPSGQNPLTSPSKDPPPLNKGVGHDVAGGAGEFTVGTSGADTSMPSPVSANMFDEEGLGNPMTTAQIMEIANSMDSMDMGWISHELLDHNSW